MRLVSFKVAKALKEAGYPQEWYDCEYYYTGNGKLRSGDDCESDSIKDIAINRLPAPTYIEVWLWLWREKRIALSICCDEDYRLEKQWYPYAEKLTGELGSFTEDVFYADPEEAIIAAIEYYVDNNLLK